MGDLKPLRFHGNPEELKQFPLYQMRREVETNLEGGTNHEKEEALS